MALVWHPTVVVTLWTPVQSLYLSSHHQSSLFFFFFFFSSLLSSAWLLCVFNRLSGIIFADCSVVNWNHCPCRCWCSFHSHCFQVPNLESGWSTVSEGWRPTASTIWTSKTGSSSWDMECHLAGVWRAWACAGGWEISARYSRTHVHAQPGLWNPVFSLGED